MTDTKEITAVRRTAKHLHDARADFWLAIATASQRGESTRAIAKAAGLSHQRVWQILRGE